MVNLAREIAFSRISANSNKQGVLINIITKDALVVLLNKAMQKHDRAHRRNAPMTYKRELTSPISVRLPRETKARLEQIAEEKHMELSPFVVAIVEDWLKMRKDIGESAMNWHTYINNSEYKQAMQELIRDTFLDSVINTPNYRDNIKDVVKRVLSEASREEKLSRNREKK